MREECSLTANSVPIPIEVSPIPRLPHPHRGGPSGTGGGATPVGDAARAALRWGRCGGRAGRACRGWALRVAAVVPRVLERPRVQPPAYRFRLCLGVPVDATSVLDIRQSVSLLDQPPVDLGAAHRADGDHPPVAVGVPADAGDVLALYEVRERESRLTPAAVDLPVPNTGLRGFWGVHAVQPDPDPSNLEGVTIGHGRDADDLCDRCLSRGGRRDQQGNQGQEAHGDRVEIGWC